MFDCHNPVLEKMGTLTRAMHTKKPFENVVSPSSFLDVKLKIPVLTELCYT